MVNMGVHVGSPIRGDPTDLTEDLLPVAGRCLKNLPNNMFIDEETK